MPAGLTASEADVAVLEGTPAHAQAMAARQVQPRRSPAQIVRALCNSYFGRNEQHDVRKCDAMWWLCSRQHVREEYEAVRPVADALAAAYPDLIHPEHVDLGAYLGAVELLYSHALEARRPPPVLFTSFDPQSH